MTNTHTIAAALCALAALTSGCESADLEGTWEGTVSCEVEGDPGAVDVAGGASAVAATQEWALSIDLDTPDGVFEGGLFEGDGLGSTWVERDEYELSVGLVEVMEPSGGDGYTLAVTFDEVEVDAIEDSGGCGSSDEPITTAAPVPYDPDGWTWDGADTIDVAGDPVGVGSCVGSLSR